jgi:hypothetical protein
MRKKDLKIYDYKVLLINIDSFLKKQNTIWDYKNKSINEEVVDNIIYIISGNITDNKIEEILTNIKQFKKNNPVLKEKLSNEKIKIEQELYSITNPNKESIYELYELLNVSFVNLRKKNIYLKDNYINYKKNILIITNNEKEILDGLFDFHIVYKKKRMNEETKPCLNKNTSPINIHNYRK